MSQARLAYPQRKVQAMQRVKELAARHSLIAVTKLYKVRSQQVMELKKKSLGRLTLLVVKDKIAALALRTAGLPAIDDFIGHLDGQNALIFTDIDPFELTLLFEKERVYLPARPGDTATEDIVVPSGNTGLAPGPVLSEFKEAGVATRIEGGTIWVAKDMVVAKKGTVITPKLASLLSRLGIKPIKAGLSVAFAYWQGHFLRAEDLQLDIGAFKASLSRAELEGYQLGLAIGYPDPVLLPTLIMKARKEAEALAQVATYITAENAPRILSHVHAQAQLLHRLLSASGYS